MSSSLIIIGGGLAGSEAAWQAAEHGIPVKLYEMRPGSTTGAHTTENLAELVCSNSLGSNLPDRASGLLKEELRRLGSLLVRCADQTSVPAGGALAVDRVEFSKLVTQRIYTHPNIEIIRKEVNEIPNDPTIIASGPLTSDGLSKAISVLTGNEHLYFFDAIAPIVTLNSINMEISFRGSRYDRGTVENGDYINCPFDEQEYDAFVTALSNAERIALKEFDSLHEEGSGVKAGAHKYFEGCLPVEVLARRDRKALAFGPLRSVGLHDPRTGRRPFAVAQLRQDNLAGSLYNLVGFQTNLKFPEQRRVFRMIPGLENCEFARYGQMHRNTFIYSPDLLEPTMQFKFRPDLFFAGQITGIEGYAGNIASGLLAGINAAQLIKYQKPMKLPRTTMLGALCHYVTHAVPADFQPMKANFGIMPPLSIQNKRMNKHQRAQAYAERALQDLRSFVETHLKNEKVKAAHKLRIATNSRNLTIK